MGPYCKFCNERCFQHRPNFTPKYILEAYGDWSTIMATCSPGKKYEKDKFGYNIDDARREQRDLITRARSLAMHVNHLDEFFDTSHFDLFVDLYAHYLGDRMSKEYLMQEMERIGIDNFGIIKIFKRLEEEKNGKRDKV